MRVWLFFWFVGLVFFFISLACWVLVLILPCENNWFCGTPQRTSAFSSQTCSASLSWQLSPWPCCCRIALREHPDRHCCHCPALVEGQRHCKKVNLLFTPLGASVGHFMLCVEGNKGDELSYFYHKLSHSLKDFLSRVHAAPCRPVQQDVIRTTWWEQPNCSLMVACGTFCPSERLEDIS